MRVSKCHNVNHIKPQLISTSIANQNSIKKKASTRADVAKAGKRWRNGWINFFTANTEPND